MPNAAQPLPVVAFPMLTTVKKETEKDKFLYKGR